MNVLKKKAFRKLKHFYENFSDDQEYIRFKLTVVMILTIIGMTLD